MDFRFTPEQEAFRAEVREFLSKEWPAERELLAGRSSDPELYGFEVAFRKKLAEKGWLALDWPKEYGGSERPFMDRYILSYEAWYHGATYSLTALHIVAPVLMRYGSEEQKREFLPRIASGEIDFALGFSEPQAGSDLASLTTQAVRDGDFYSIDGQKVYTSFAHVTDYVWLAARTDPDAPAKHKGISLFIVPIDAAGLRITPLVAMDGEQTTITFYDDVRVPVSARVGEENRGWYYTAASLDYERVSLFPVARLRRFFDRLRAALAAGDVPPDERTRTRRRLASLAVEIEIAEILSHRSAWLMDRGEELTYESGVTKIFVTELYQRIANEIVNALGLYGQIAEHDAARPLVGDAAQLYKYTVMQTFGGGASEVLRNVVAQRGFHMPRGAD